MKKYAALLFLILCTLTALSQQIIATADSLMLNAEYENALIFIEKNSAVTDPAQRILLENKKAEALIHVGKFADAERTLKSLQSNNHVAASAYFLGIIKTNVGLLYMNQGRNDLALEALREALQAFERDNKANSLEASQSMAYLGQVYKSTGKHEQAEEQLQMALTFRLNKLKSEHELIAASYNDLGVVYTQLDNDKALDYYEKALAIYQKLHGKDHPKIAIASTNIGFIYRELELYGDAVNNFETALKIYEKVYAQPHAQKAFVLFNLGETYKSMGNQKAARGYYDRALAMYQTTYGKKHPELAIVLNAIGNIEMGAANFNAAISFYQQALRVNVSDFESAQESANPQLRNFYNGNVLLYSLHFKSQALEARHFGKTLKFGDLSMSLNTLQLCDSLIDKLRQQITNENDKITLGAIANEVYGDGVRVAHEAARVALKKKPFLELSFYFAEKSKSATLLEAISDSDAKSFAGIPANLLEEEKTLKSAIALTAQKLAQKPSDAEEQYLRETSFNLNRAYEGFVKNLEKEFPQYFNLKFNAASPSIAQLQSLLNSKTALISYFTDDKNSRIYIFLLTGKTYRIIDHALPGGFDKSITGLRNGLYFNEINSFKRSSSNLAEILIPKIPTRIKDLVILPTGRLSVVPFEALLTRKSENITEYKSLPYLLNRFSLRYEFSAGLLLQKSKQPLEATNSIFLCAPVTFPEKDHLNDLPGSESEVKEISQLFTSKNYENAVFTRQQADEHLIKSSALKKYDLLHFATHGVVDENDPELSRIFLQNSSEAEDGNLFAGEIYNLELNANLVTLSACETGLGKISKGEGVIGLSRALVYAGARNIVVSFWSVADESTADLMKDFYKLLLESKTGYAASLRSAKLNLMKSAKYAAPYYWAPFILIGF